MAKGKKDLKFGRGSGGNLPVHPIRRERFHEPESLLDGRGGDQDISVAGYELSEVERVLGGKGYTVGRAL